MTGNHYSIKKMVNEFIKKQRSISTLRFITCGSVDDGKSTLIGRMLFDSKIIFNDQIDDIKTINKKSKKENKMDFSLLLDGLIAEREQKITIDIAHRYFQTSKRRFIVADTPGHEEYTKNMVTGASVADLAIILVNAKKGILPQTLRHSFICSFLGIKNIILVINKMDLVKYDKAVFNTIKSNYHDKVRTFNFNEIVSIPISALEGLNIIKKSNKMDWFKGKPLLKVLENIEVKNFKKNKNSIFQVQRVGIDKNNQRFYSGIMRDGNLKKNQKITIHPSGEENVIKRMLLYKKTLLETNPGESISIFLKKEVDISRGYLISDLYTRVGLSDQFQSRLIWLSKNEGYTGRLYYLKMGGFTVDVQITKIKNIVNVYNSSYVRSSKLVLNDVGIVEISINKKIPFQSYDVNRSLGSFIIIDRITYETLGAGMINFSMRRSDNIFQSDHVISKTKRNLLNGHKSKVLWFTGLSGSGKSTIANNLEKKLHKDGIKTFILDGDNIRKGLNKDLGFKLEDRVENIRRIAEVSKIMVEAGILVLVAFISPFRAERDMARSLFKAGDFLEIFVNTSLKVAEKRDVKGLYAKARKGKILNFTGISSPYEKPINPDIELKTEKQSVTKTVNYLYNKLDLKID